MAESSDRRPASEDSFAHLRSIIVGPEQRELVALRTRMLDPTVQTRDVSRILPDALQLRAHDPQLMRALAPSIEDAITASVKKDPQPLADALFPVIGPAIRKAVSHTFDAMIESLNHAIERTVSWHAVQWRFTAWRTGRPYAEVVLAHTLEYRVEQVFLIHRESGLLLQQAASRPDSERDADQISAMLTAITDFARDSFKVGGSDSLESLRVGDLAVSVVQGPHAILAAVVRGSIPLAVRAAFETALESIHRQFGAQLQAYDGNADAFAPARPILESCLVSQRRRSAARPSYRWWAFGAAILLLALTVWIYLDFRAGRSWNAYLDRLRDEPGIVVVSSERSGGRFFISGLRDPLAADPRTLLAAAPGLAPQSVDSRWEPYQALHPPFIQTRAALLLQPPSGVSLTLADGVLTATGAAPQRWVDESGRLALAVPGVSAFVFAGESAERQRAREIEATTIRFRKGQSTIEPSQQDALVVLVDRVKALDAMLAATGRRAHVEVLGYADSDGSDEFNFALSADRADDVLSALRAAKLGHVDLSARGMGRVPLAASATEAEHERNRRVSVTVRLTDDALLRSRRP